MRAAFSALLAAMPASSVVVRAIGSARTSVMASGAAYLWNDYERNEREEPGSRYTAEDMDRQLEVTGAQTRRAASGAETPTRPRLSSTATQIRHSLRRPRSGRGV